MQAFLERCSVVCDMNENPMKHKVGVGVVVARRSGALNALDAIHHFFLNHEMYVVGSTYWNLAYAQLPGDVVHDIEGINNMSDVGENMHYLLNALKHQKNKT